MNDVDAVITQCTIIEQMCSELCDYLGDECDSDEVLNLAMSISGVAAHIHRQLDDKHTKAWNKVVVPLHKQQFSNASKRVTTSRAFENTEKTGVIDLS